jgi:hypothetical protein
VGSLQSIAKEVSNLSGGCLWKSYSFFVSIVVSSREETNGIVASSREGQILLSKRSSFSAQMV